MKAQEFLSRAVPKKAGIFVVSGSEEFLRREVVDAIRDAFPEHELISRDGSDPALPLASVLDELRMADLFGGQRLVHLKRAEGMVKTHQKALERFVNQKESLHPLILEGDSLLAKKPGKAPPKTGLWGAVHSAGGKLIWCLPLYDSPFRGGPPEKSPLSSWVVDRARSLGKKISLQDAYLLHRLAGTALSTLDGELRKLSTYLGKRERIEAEDIERTVGAGRQAPLFELAEQVAQRNLPEALQRSALIFERGIKDGTSGKQLRDASVLGILIVRTLVTTLRRIFGIAEEMERGGRFDEAAKSQKLPPFLYDKVRAQVRGYDDPALRLRVLKGVGTLDRDLKSGAGDARVLVERFLVESLQAASASRTKERSWRK